MKGHIRKRTWAIVVDIGRHPDTRKRRRRWLTVHGTKHDAERKQHEILLGLD